MTCNHLFAHWTTEEEKQDIIKTMNYLRGINDMQGFFMHFVRLTEPCDARKTPEATLEELREVTRLRCEYNLNDGMPPEQCPAIEGVTLCEEDDSFYCPPHRARILEEIGKG